MAGPPDRILTTDRNKLAVIIKEAAPMIPYPICQGQLGESDGSKDAKNPKVQKAAIPMARIDAMTRETMDLPEMTRAERNTKASVPTTMNKLEFIWRESCSGPGGTAHRYNQSGH